MSTAPASTILTIAGFDPSSGAGVTADLLVFAAHGLFGTSCITSLTVQSTLGVRSVHSVDAQIIADTLACLDHDLPAAGIKIGMLGSVHAIEAVCGFLEHLSDRIPKVPVVLDPVLQSSSGRELLDSEGMDLLQARMLPLADWITPNLSELSLLSGHSANNLNEMNDAAEVLQRKIAPVIGVLATGGHLDPPDDLLLTRDGERHWLRGTRVETNATHGTGCALSSALLSRLVLGDEALTAAHAAKRYVAQALKTATPRGHGHGPMNHLWPLRFSS